MLPFELISTACYLFRKLTKPLVENWPPEDKQVIIYLDYGLGIEQDDELLSIVKQDFMKFLNRGLTR